MCVRKKGGVPTVPVPIVSVDTVAVSSGLFRSIFPDSPIVYVSQLKLKS